jgi:hypothetical protein
MWAGVVHDSELIGGLEQQNGVHPFHNPSLFEGLMHYVLRLKECVVEVVARTVVVRRVDDATEAAAAQARH